MAAHQATVKSAHWKALKDAGWVPEKKFVQYTVDELTAASAFLELNVDVQEPVQATPPVSENPAPPQAAEAASIPNKAADPNELPGQRLNQGFEPIRTDDQGRVWYQEEVLKPAFPKPRGRRVLRYQDTGVEMQTVKAGEYTESFEVAGQGPGKAAEIKITLPSYQVGIYKDPRFPFKVHTYNGNEGFDLWDVQEFYGGAELVPASVKRKYVENTLCYDMRSVINTIQTEYRQNQLAGRVK